MFFQRGQASGRLPLIPPPTRRTPQASAGTTCSSRGLMASSLFQEASGPPIARWPRRRSTKPSPPGSSLQLPHPALRTSSCWAHLAGRQHFTPSLLRLTWFPTGLVPSTHRWQSICHTPMGARLWRSQRLRRSGTLGSAWSAGSPCLRLRSSTPSTTSLRRRLWTSWPTGPAWPSWTRLPAGRRSLGWCSSWGMSSSGAAAGGGWRSRLWRSCSARFVPRPFGSCMRGDMKHDVQH
mmetsp:Transcript_13741/g.38901  ORF Transcript_13741/g.38901 Transcript_13741/m.38901 type:complete len:236 (+) Transcript_13741:1320-2027(+)